MQGSDDTTQVDGQKKLAGLVAERRSELGMTQADLSAAAAISLATVQSIEAGRAGNLRGRTAAGIDRGLAWEPGSAARVLRGGEPKPASDQSGHVEPDYLSLVGAALAGPVDIYDPMPLMRALVSQNKLTPGALGRVFARFTQSPPDSVASAHEVAEKELGWPSGAIAQLTSQPAEQLVDDLPDVIRSMIRLQEKEARLQEKEARSRDPKSILVRQLHDGELRHQELEVLLQAGISGPDLDRVVAHLIERRRQFNNQMLEDLNLMIVLTKVAKAD